MVSLISPVWLRFVQVLRAIGFASALPGSMHRQREKLKGHRVGVIGGNANAKIGDPEQGIWNRSRENVRSAQSVLTVYGMLRLAGHCAKGSRR